MTSADLLAQLRERRREYKEAQLVTVERKLELTAAHERMLIAQAAEQDLTRAVEILEHELLRCVETEAEVAAERRAAG